MTDFSSVEKAIGQIRKQSATIAARIESFHQERDQLLTAPMCNADVMDQIASTLDQSTAEAPLLIEHLVTQLKERPMRDDSKPWPLWGYANFEKTLTALLAPQIKSALAAVIAALPDDEAAGPRLAQRRTRLTELDKLLDEANTELASLRQKASRAGINLKGAAL